ncbi:MAG: response regulator [Solirubrobacteraceae bacterium]
MDDANNTGDPVPAAETPSHRRRVMIADDDPTIRAMLEATLAAEFDVVGAAADGEDAVRMASRLQPDAAVIDHFMPNGGGELAVRGIADASPGTAIVMLSVEESEANVRQFLDMGAIACCRKGVSPPVLRRAVREAIEVWRDNALPDDLVASLDAFSLHREVAHEKASRVDRVGRSIDPMAGSAGWD